MIDSSLLGQTAAKCMEDLDGQEAVDGGTIISVGIVTITEDAEGNTTFIKTFCSDEHNYRQIGLFYAALDLVEQGIVEE